MKIIVKNISVKNYSLKEVYMFIGRQQEIKELNEFLSSERSKAALIYGKRRIGKTTLIQHVLADVKKDNIFFEASEDTYESNLSSFTDLISTSLSIPLGSYKSFSEVFAFLKVTAKPLVVVIDEFQYLMTARSEKSAESEFKQIIDNLPSNIKLILTGSYVTAMKEIILEDRPLFGRFDLIQNIGELDYLISREFYKNHDLYNCVEFHAVFGGSPFILSLIREEESLSENIKRLLLNPTGIARTYIEFILFKEVGKVGILNDILRVLGNGKLRYSQIENKLNLKSTGLLSKYLKLLEKMDLVDVTIPVNKKADDKKTFYSIKDNLVRFFYAYIYPNKSQLQNIGADAFFESYISPSLTTFISYRFEGIVRDYLMLRASRESLPVLNIGTYWYDDKLTRTNGEFDCVVQYKTYYMIYEVKFYSRPMSVSEIHEEVKQIESITEIENKKIGFVCTGGFEEKIDGYEYITIDDVYSVKW